MEHRSSRRIKINIPFLINCIIIIRVNKTNTNEKLITLPSDVRLSKILTGNELGLLGGLPKLPISEEIENFVKSLPDYKQLIALKTNSEQFTSEKHKIAQKYLELNKIEEALKILLFKL